MSLVADQVRRLDAQIDRISLVPLTLNEQDVEDQGFDGQSAQPGLSATDALSSPRVGELVRIAKSLSSSSTSKTTLSSARIQALLVQSGLTGDRESFHDLAAKSQYETEIEWLLVGKATVQTYGLLLNTLLDQIIPLSDDIWYWDDVLGSYWSSALYTVQTSPIRMWGWSRDIYSESLDRFHRLRRDRHGPASYSTRSGLHGNESDDEGDDEGRQDHGQEHDQDQDQDDDQDADSKHSASQTESLSRQWRQFYSIVRESIAERTITDLRRRVVSHVGIGRADARRKQSQLRKLREMTATGLGILMVEGLSFGTTEEGESDHEWKGLLERSVALMDVILRKTHVLDVGLSEYEDKVFAGVEEDPELSIHAEDSVDAERPSILARRILDILQTGLPRHTRNMAQVAGENGRPSKLVRFWLPAVVLLVSSSTILRVLANRKEDIINWIRDLGATTRDFWFNWVVEPIRKIIGTIRHDSTSEIAIMSRDSLKADRDSLERMVVEFSTDRPDVAVGAPSITETQIADIRSKVKEGDVTPVLKAYEQGLRRPFVGAVKGDLVRSLLIQVQKTKVDLEVAISGIDALLKSQELVFGFVGLTPGILVSIGLFQYLRNVLWNRKGLRRGQKARRTTRVMRKIDKILSDATPSPTNVISYKDHGLLLCEVHLLRRLAHGVLPSEVEKEFIEDADELANLRGINVQMRALDRIRWAYAEWLGRMG
ncbi:ATP synthase regulation protein NCA2-domain-containing protein [Cercophora newfieldiana]|uniref:ATP synthase regulation protein NCA2-domain-containing protein n=1 Tax=Cercophora newfieldiana TaxID=92897 RepID=A0AA39Y1B1_9PEZI|nr:ATP synthase regulation protein NCA2-domain-containing protein [Cercophora newfieldiana]